MPHSVLQTSLWETVKCDLKGLFPEDVFAMWFEPMSCVEAGEDDSNGPSAFLGQSFSIDRTLTAGELVDPDDKSLSS